MSKIEKCLNRKNSISTYCYMLIHERGGAGGFTRKRLVSEMVADKIYSAPPSIDNALRELKGCGLIGYEPTKPPQLFTLKNAEALSIPEVAQQFNRYLARFYPELAIGTDHFLYIRLHRPDVLTLLQGPYRWLLPFTKDLAWFMAQRENMPNLKRMTAEQYLEHLKQRESMAAAVCGMNIKQFGALSDEDRTNLYNNAPY